MADGPIAFLDRDGTINVSPPEGDYVRSWDGFELLPRVPEGIRLLREAGMRIVVVTNQRGVALGLMRLEAVDCIHRRMAAELERSGAALDAVYVCPHALEECECRKPRPGMLRQAQRDLPGVDLEQCVIVGDSGADMQAGAAVGCSRVLIDPAGTKAPGVAVDHVADSLWDAAVWITGGEGARP